MDNTSPLRAVRESLAADRAALRAAVEGVPEALRSQKPAPGRWSVAEVLEHLSIVEARSVAMLGPLIESAPAIGSPDAVTPLDRARLLDRSRKLSAPDAIQPTGTVTADAAWTALERSRVQLLEILETAEGRDLTRIGRPHPAFGTLDGYQWLAAVGGHEERHAAQILEIAGMLAAAEGPQ
jgi:hypothetical protein